MPSCDKGKHIVVIAVRHPFHGAMTVSTDLFDKQAGYQTAVHSLKGYVMWLFHYYRSRGLGLRGVNAWSLRLMTSFGVFGFS